jgi:hypothetical protein
MISELRNSDGTSQEIARATDGTQVEQYFNELQEQREEEISQEINRLQALAQEQEPQQDLILNIQTLESDKPSIKPSIEESERFIQFLNHKFNLGLRNDLIILIHETRNNTRGFFRSVKCPKIWKEPSKTNILFKQEDKQEPKQLNSIVLSAFSSISPRTSPLLKFLKRHKRHLKQPIS